MNASSMNATPLCLQVTLQLRPGCEEQAAACLEQLAAASRREPGCLVYNAHRSLETPGRLLIYEIYRDQAALEAHRASSHFARYASGELYTLVESRAAELYGPIALA
ncbi:MAG TPA: putative quinol monooxygenase [Terriglobales bacterium]|nr:putative quinol monooxygenase [Terriglobales bacterium]